MKRPASIFTPVELNLDLVSVGEIGVIVDDGNWQFDDATERFKDPSGVLYFKPPHQFVPVR